MNIKVGDFVTTWSERARFDTPSRIRVAKVFKRYFETENGQQWDLEDGRACRKNPHHKSARAVPWTERHETEVDRCTCRDLILQAGKEKLRTASPAAIKELADAVRRFLAEKDPPG